MRVMGMQPESPSDSAARQVLVVDDNRDGAQTLAMLLRFAGHQVKVAFSGIQALQIAQEQKPNVILLDLAMPGMDGFQVAQALRERPETKDALIIAVSGYCLLYTSPSPRDRQK